MMPQEIVSFKEELKRYNNQVITLAMKKELNHEDKSYLEDLFYDLNRREPDVPQEHILEYTSLLNQIIEMGGMV